jgi:hypothetical protein
MPERENEVSQARRIAGRLNRRKRKSLTDQGRRRLRAAIKRYRPWEHSTGPKTPGGKARSAQNGKLRQKGPVSVRELRNELAKVTTLLDRMGKCRRELSAESTRDLG